MGRKKFKSFWSVSVELFFKSDAVPQPPYTPSKYW